MTTTDFVPEKLLLPAPLSARTRWSHVPALLPDTSLLVAEPLWIVDQLPLATALATSCM